jgi:hypothetical protein
MGPISPNLQVSTFAVLAMVGTIFVRRKCRWKGFLAFWLASTALSTTFYVIRSPPLPFVPV